MPRETKYRVWDTRAKEWVQDLPIYISMDGVVHFLHNNNLSQSNVLQEAPYAIVNDWTGLKDKNGKEIYEGDILKDLPYCNKAGDVLNAETYAVIVCREPSINLEIKYYFKKRYEGKEYWDCNWCELNESKLAKEYEVIGNIYENPELLKGQEE